MIWSWPWIFIFDSLNKWTCNLHFRSSTTKSKTFFLVGGIEFRTNFICIWWWWCWSTKWLKDIITFLWNHIFYHIRVLLFFLAILVQLNRRFDIYILKWIIGKNYNIFVYELNLVAFGKENNILDLEVFVGLLHIYTQFEAIIDIVLRAFNNFKSIFSM